MFGRVNRVGGVQSLAKGLTNGTNGCYGIVTPPSQGLHDNGEEIYPARPTGKEGGGHLSLDDNTKGMPGQVRTE